MKRMLLRWTVACPMALIITLAIYGCGTRGVDNRATTHPVSDTQMPDMSFAGVYGNLPCPDATPGEDPGETFEALGGEAFGAASRDQAFLDRVVPPELGTLQQSWACQQADSVVLVTTNGSRVVLTPLANFDVSGYIKQFLAYDPGTVMQLGGRPVLVTPSDGIKQASLQGWPEPGRGTAQFRAGHFWVVILGNHLESPERLVDSAAHVIGVDPKTAVDVSRRWRDRTR